MITIKAFYYDGRTSTQTPVSVSFYESGEVLIKGETMTLRTTQSRLSITSRLGDTRRSIFLPGGAKLETDDNEGVDRVCGHFARNPCSAVLHQLEKHWHFVVPAFVISVVLIWVGIEYGVPVAAKWTAKGLPRAIEQEIGAQTLTTLEQWLFADSHTDTVRRLRLQQRFRKITQDSTGAYHYRLLLRDSRKMGANALALPGGIIVVTDALLELAENDEQVLAVLAHEMGHVENQHGIRSLLQDSLTALLMIGLLGDVTSISSLSATLPTVLVESRYSRTFEQEADRYAVNILNSHHIDIGQFIRILTLLEHVHDAGTEFDYLSSHPAMSKRIDLIRSLQALQR